MKKLLILFFCLSFLFGCQCSRNYNYKAANISITPLEKSAESIDNSLIELASIQKAVYPAQKLNIIPDARRLYLAQLASIDWSGPIEPLVRNIADTSGYKVRYLGKKPALPILVVVTKKNVPLAEVLRDAAYQALDKVDIVIFPKMRVIEIRYISA